MKATKPKIEEETARVVGGIQGPPDEKPETKEVQFSARVTQAVAMAKHENKSWGEWVTFLTAQYCRSSSKSPVADPATRHLFAWAAVSLDEIGRAVTGHALDGEVRRASDIQKLVDALRIQEELARVRVALESWHQLPVTPKEGVSNDHR